MLCRMFVVIFIIVVVLVVGWLVFCCVDIFYDMLEIIYFMFDIQFMILDDGLKVYYIDIGLIDWFVLVLVYGFLFLLYIWDVWKMDLEVDYWVIMLDLLGYGLMCVDDLIQFIIECFVDVVYEVIQDFGVSWFILVGNFMGGNIVWLYVLVYLEILEGLIFVDVLGWLEIVEDNENSLFIFMLLFNLLVWILMKDLDMMFLMWLGLEDFYIDQSFVIDVLVECYVVLLCVLGY